MSLENKLNTKEARRMENDYKKTQEYKLVKELQDMGLNYDEIRSAIKSTKNGNPHDSRTYKIGKNNISFGVISDTHIGNINYNPNWMKSAAKQFDKQNVDFVVHVGDVLDGLYSNRPGQVYELNAIGADAQVNMALKDLSLINKPIFFITGNHEGNAYFKQCGHDIGPILKDKLELKGKKVTYLGRDEGRIVTKGGASIMLSHPGDGSSYAISYKSQKKIESLTGGEKPSVLLIGHYHKAEYLFYRNVHVLQCGTLCGQTEFMRSKGISANTGYWIAKMTTNNKGEITSFTPTFYPFYKG